MKPLTALLIDDEKHCTETLSWQLETYCPEVKILGTFNDSRDGLEAIYQLSPQVVFLDVEMPHLNGFELLAQLGSRNFEVVFTTAYDEFALRAFRASATDYLLKPIQRIHLREAVRKLLGMHRAPWQKEQLDILKASLGKPEDLPPQVALPVFDGLEFRDPRQIAYCLSENNYSQIHFATGEKILVTRPLKDMESLLEPYHFVRIHHSHLVNLSFLKRYVKGDGGYVVLKDGTTLNVSRSRKQDLMDRF